MPPSPINEYNPTEYYFPSEPISASPKSLGLAYSAILPWIWKQNPVDGNGVLVQIHQPLIPHGAQPEIQSNTLPPDAAIIPPNKVLTSGDSKKQRSKGNPSSISTGETSAHSDQNMIVALITDDSDTLSTAKAGEA